MTSACSHFKLHMLKVNCYPKCWWHKNVFFMVFYTHCYPLNTLFICLMENNVHVIINNKHSFEKKKLYMQIIDTFRNPREAMESLVLEVSRVCLDRRETKVPEVSLDPLDPSACRWVDSLVCVNPKGAQIHANFRSNPPQYSWWSSSNPVCVQ